MYDRGRTVGELRRVGPGLWAAVIPHPDTREELVVGVWIYKEAASRLWELHSVADARRRKYLNG